MSIAALLRELRANDILLSLNGDALVVDAPEALITDELRARIAASKPEILSLLRAARGDGHGLKLTPAPRDQRIPLSSAQRRLWFLNRLDPGETVYNMGLGLDVAEPVDVDALERALAALVSRHDILRTAFPDDEGEPSQVVTERAPPLVVADLRLLPEGEREARLDAERQIAVAYRFRLAERPPFNTTLIRWGEEKALLVIVLHHILADGWSLDLLAAEFAQLYADGVEGRAPSAVPPKWRYADYAWSQQEWLHHANLDEATAYWRRTLAGELTPLDLPTDHPHAAILSSHGATHRFSLSRELSASLRARSREAGTTLFTMLLATYELLLHRYTGQTDILVGTPVANRPLVELEPLVGLFASTVVLRADLAGDPSFRDLLRRAQEAVLGAFDHQAYPFDKVVELVRPERSRSRTPLFQTMFSLQGTPAPGAPPYEIFGSGAHFELSLGAWDDGERIHGRWEYNADLFDASTIERMSGHFVNLAESVAADPTRRLSALSPLTPAELARMTVEWNDTAAPFPAECAHELVDAQAAATPLAEAVRFGDVSVTYGELVARANQLAHRLKAAGVGRERLVGICLDRGPE